MLGVSLKSTWFLMHRIREAMRETHPMPMGSSTPVQADETFIGKRTMRNREWYTRGYQIKEPVLTLIGDGKVRSYHVKEVNSATLKPILREQIAKSASLFTDEATYYHWAGGEFTEHATINHSIKEYVRGEVTVNACENYFSILKRGLNGVYQHVSPKHLRRYVGEFDMRYNTREMSDVERTEKVARGTVGKKSLIVVLVRNNYTTPPRNHRRTSKKWYRASEDARDHSSADPRQLAFRFDDE